MPFRKKRTESDAEEPIVVTRTAAVQLMMLGKTGAFSLPGIVQPSTEPAESATLRDDAEVIGVQIEGQFRAYCISEMQLPSTHVINDVVVQVPVTVSYCNRTDCVRVFTTGDDSHQPLNVGVGGFAEGKMLLHLENRNFRQDSRDIPLPTLEFERTTWKSWKTAHPDTDVCTSLDVPN